MGYIRNFVILKGDKGIGGRAIIEQRGNTRILINIKGIPQGEYLLYVFNDKAFKKQWFKIGSKGFLDLNWEITDFSAEEIRAICVLTQKLQPVLTGYVQDNFNWQRLLISSDNENKEEKSSEPQVAEIEECVSISPTTDQSDNKLKGHLKEIITEFDDNIRELKSMGQEDTSPFGDDGYVWEKTDLKQLYGSKTLWKLANNPFVVHGYRCYHHIYLGKSNSSSALAVPCVYCKSYTLESQLQGFREIKPLKDKELKEGQLCYCIIKL